MKISTKLTNYLKNLRSTQVSPNLRIPQGVQVEASFSASRIKVPELLTSFGKAMSRAWFSNSARTSISPKTASASASILAPALALAIAVLGASLFSQAAYAASYINVSSGSGGTISFDSIKPSSAGVSASASDTLTITTNCSAGYKVYVSGQENGDTNLTNSSASSNNTISASSTAVGSAATALSSNTWGITGDSANASANKYVGLPAYANATDAALITVPSASTSGDNKNTIYYGVKVDTTLTPGTYSGDVLYTTLVTEACNNYTVHFDANGGSGSMSDQTIPVGTATSLTMNAFTRSGYMFLGWGTSSSDTTPTYKDGEKVTDISNFNTTINLYALWGQSTGNMQDFKCTDLASGTTTYLTDTRDNQVYSVYRIPTDQTYKDSSTVANIAGKCLMTKDLSLGYNSSADLNLNTDTSVAAGTITYVDSANGGTGWSTNDADTNLQYTYGPRSNYEVYSSHSYYSFGAAQKVCPKNWRLPTSAEYASGSSSATQTTGLAAIVGNSINGSKALQAYPWSFVLGGYFNAGSWNSQGSNGDYWSSTQYGPTIGYVLGFSSSKVYQTSTYKDGGHSVRCIAEDNYAISYSNTGADSGEASKTSESAYESGSVTMPTVGSMKKDGYEFKGWALTSGASEATYTAEQTVTISDLLTAASSAGQATTPGSTITLYPVWEKSVAYMQETAAKDLTENATTTLRDSRDNQDYTVYRWPSTGTAGTDYPTGMAGYAIMTKDLSLGYVTGGSITKGSNLVLSTDTSAGSSTSEAPVYARTSTGNWDKTDADSNIQYVNGASRSYYSYGAAQIVCPKGWKPPTKTEYSNIVTFMGGDNSAGSFKIRRAPYNFVYGGFFGPSGWVGNGSDGYYWSSTQSYPSIGDSLYFSSDPLYVGSVNKGLGLPVRCIQDPAEDCSDTVHPTASIGCKMKDGREWILGNSGNSTTWNSICANAQNKDDPTDSSTTYASCSSCPSGYTFPRITDFDKLVQAYGGTSYINNRSGYRETTGALYKVLGPSSSRSYWSSTEYDSGGVYNLSVDSSGSHSSSNYAKADNVYVLCYK